MMDASAIIIVDAFIVQVVSAHTIDHHGNTCMYFDLSTCMHFMYIPHAFVAHVSKVHVRGW